MPRDRFVRQALGANLSNCIRHARVLMVGAGGIGCELLKNLALTGFGEIHIVDLDTIDLSNLNRQFLFRHEHIKRSKALVAKETASKFNPNVKIIAHHANIKDPTFNLDFFSSFALVFNALDNLDARRHVNRMCLAADVPLVESGTTGFNGQVQVIKRGVSECYDCTTKETPKTFPVCTIRSTPSQPIHCIVWAKSYLFAEIFGTSEDEASDLDTTQDAENAAEIEKLRAEAQALKRIRDSMGSEDFPRLVFNKVYKDDIDRLRSMEDMWRSRKKPNPLDFDALTQESLGVGENIMQQDQTAWTVAENFAVFARSLKTLSDRLDELRASTETENAPPVLSFDKDDKDTLDFVASAANLRSIIFGIETKSEFEIKQMAGNIIPAIATANAMTAALCVQQSLHVLRAFMPRKPPPDLTPEQQEKWSQSLQQNPNPPLSRARWTFLAHHAVDKRMSSEPLRPPNPHCSICGVAHARIQIDSSRATLRDLVDTLLKQQLGYTDEVAVTTDAGVIFDPDLDDNLEKLLSELSVGEDSTITITDEEEEEPRVNLVLNVSDKKFGVGEAPLKLLENFEIKRKPPKPVEEAIAAAKPATANGIGHVVAPHTNGDGDISMVGDKRKRGPSPEALEAEMARKRGKVMEERPKSNGELAAAGDDGPVTIEDDGDGVIAIDDD